jgi:hypothetical protein
MRAHSVAVLASDQSNAELRKLLAELINAFNRNIDRMAGAMRLSMRPSSLSTCSLRAASSPATLSPEMPDGGARVGSPLVHYFARAAVGVPLAKQAHGQPSERR